ncbi:peroxiredoxin [Tautonia rosea]|uniref:peroxiredoxin n=1 Tax=Tautonia rosea TaxID=2728037 RepID=UPI0019D22C2A|nr:peroxiredoxin [Tautonia rosea]
MLTVGQSFPKFQAHGCVGAAKDSLTTFDNNSFRDQWIVYFFYPKDFTFVCPTEIAEFNKRLGEFKDRDAMVVGGSTDNEFSHLAWCQSHEDLKGLKYPLIGAQKLAADLGILHPEEGVCLRATFIVDPEGTIQFATANGLSVGRNVDEIVRVLDALQSGELCPCNWKKGEETIKV